jgi:hypothetical protein
MGNIMGQVDMVTDPRLAKPASTDPSSKEAASEEVSPEEIPGDDRRAWQRFMLEDRACITLEVEGGAHYNDVELIDISLGGFGLKFAGELPENASIAICHPTAGKMIGRLAWQKDQTIGVRMQDDENRRIYLLRLVSMILHSEMQVAATV